MKVKPKRKPVELPSSEDVWKAVELLRNQVLHYYQILLYEGLSEPNGYPITVERKESVLGPTTRVVMYPKHKPELSYTFNETDSDEDVINKARFLLDGLTKKKIHPKACCGYAKFRNCVCEVSFECPLHGTRCVGTHD